MKIAISSSNKGKLAEISQALGESFELFTKDMLGLGDFDVLENGESLEENAFKKSKALYDRTGYVTISDDTGLFVDALGGAPGVYTARFAGENASYEDNMDKMLDVLKEVGNLEDRACHFKTVICLVDKKGEVHYFEGRLDGYIAFEKSGNLGFGYDPIFIVKESNRSLADYNEEEKNQISHRGLALKKLVSYLKNDL